MSRGLVRDLLTYGAGRAVPAAASMVFTLLCVQTLSSADYARYSLGVLPALIAAAFVGGLAGQPLLRFGLQLDHPGLRRALVAIPLWGTLLSLPLIAGWSFVQGRAWSVDTALSLLLVPAIAITDARRAFLVASSRPGLVFWMDSARTISSVVLLWLLWQSIDRPQLVPIVAMASGTVLALLITRPLKGYTPPAARTRVDLGYVRYGAWAACWMGLITLFPLVERSLLERAHGLEVAGVYSAIADPIATLMAAGTSVVVSALSPKFVAAWEQGEKSRVRRLTYAGFAGAIGLAVIAWFAGLVIAVPGIGRLGSLLYNAPGLATFMLLVTALWQLAVFAHKPLELMRRVDLMFGSLLAAWVVFAGMAVALVDSMGGMGILTAKAGALAAYFVFVKLSVRSQQRGAI